MPGMMSGFPKEKLPRAAKSAKVAALSAGQGATLDKPSYAKGDLVTLTVTDPLRSTSDTVNTPVVGGTVVSILTVITPQGVPVASAHTFTLKSDNAATGVSVWTTTA